MMVSKRRLAERVSPSTARLRFSATSSRHRSARHHRSPHARRKAKNSSAMMRSAEIDLAHARRRKSPSVCPRAGCAPHHHDDAAGEANTTFMSLLDEQRDLRERLAITVNNSELSVRQHARGRFVGAHLRLHCERRRRFPRALLPVGRLARISAIGHGRRAATTTGPHSASSASPRDRTAAPAARSPRRRAARGSRAHRLDAVIGNSVLIWKCVASRVARGRGLRLAMIVLAEEVWPLPAATSRSSD